MPTTANPALQKLLDDRGTRRLRTRTMPQPFRLAVLPDPERARPRQYAIVTSLPLHDHHGLVGYKRGYGENHHGLHVYKFVHWFTAARVAHEIVTSGRAIWVGVE